MVALANEVRSADEPIAIHKLCIQWGAWARCALPGADGTSKGYLRERVDKAHEGEPTAEIALTESAIARMKIQRQDYWRYFARYYLNPTQLSEFEISNETNTPLERVTAILRQARILVGYHRYRLQSEAESLGFDTLKRFVVPERNAGA